MAVGNGTGDRSRNQVGLEAGRQEQSTDAGAHPHSGFLTRPTIGSA